MHHQGYFLRPYRQCSPLSHRKHYTIVFSGWAVPPMPNKLTNVWDPDKQVNTGQLYKTKYVLWKCFFVVIVVVVCLLQYFRFYIFIAVTVWLRLENHNVYGKIDHGWGIVKVRQLKHVVTFGLLYGSLTYHTPIHHTHPPHPYFGLCRAHYFLL